jgi:dTDP-4-dehydrorhamnose reductase
MKLLIIGCNGQLGSDMVLLARAAGHEVAGIDFPEIDITDLDGVRRKVGESRCDGIVNCAGYTAVDACETHEKEAYAVNAHGAGNLARCAAETGISIIHISTDYVFDGSKTSPYIETDTPNPQSAYGRSKLDGERQVAAANPRHQIFRIAWLYGIKGANFVKTIRKVAAEKAHAGEPLKVVNDQRGTPTYTREVCRQILRVLPEAAYGIFHCTAEGECTWYDFACRIVAAAKVGARVIPCATAEFPRPACRPANSVLENARLKSLGLNVMKDWKEGFADFISDEARENG